VFNMQKTYNETASKMNEVHNG